MIEYVYVVVVSHKHGDTVYAADTSTAARQCLAEYVRMWWDDARRYDESLSETAPENDDDAIAQYFNALEGSEFYSEYEPELVRGAK